MPRLYRSNARIGRKRATIKTVDARGHTDPTLAEGQYCENGKELEIRRALNAERPKRTFSNFQKSKLVTK